MDKRWGWVSIRLTDPERQALKSHCQTRELAVSDVLRKAVRLILADGQPTSEPVAKPEARPRLEVLHLDDIGPDPLYRNTGALAR